MRICLRFTGIATLLIGLQLVAPKLVEAKLHANLSNTISANQLAIASTGMGSPMLDKLTHPIQEFTPPDNSGPDITQGSGTR
ncbi:MAG: hypothetical protein LDL41_14735 [Coleofasciculus sp. S288]|nr:hypothetical protein [Coleofasciculus sp. S288]